MIKKTFTFKVKKITKKASNTVPREVEKIEGPEVTEILKTAFYGVGLKSLKEVNFPKVTKIGVGAFIQCEALDKVNFPAVTKIGDRAFSECVELSSWDKDSFQKLTEIGNDAFRRCIALDKVNFPAVTKIEGGTFAGCKALREVNFPKVTIIRKMAFAGCEALEKVNFSKETTIMVNAFCGCDALEKAVNNEVTIEKNTGVVNVTTLCLQVVCGGGKCNLKNVKDIGLIKEIYLDKELVYNYSDEEKYKIKKISRTLRGAFEKLFINQSFIKEYERNIDFEDKDFGDKKFGTYGFQQILYPYGDSPRIEDLKQEAQVGGCWIIAALTSIVANDPQAIKKSIKISDDEKKVTVSLFRCVLDECVPDKDSSSWEYRYRPGSKINITLDLTSLPVEYGRGKALWVQIIEKAMAIYLYKGYGPDNSKTKFKQINKTEGDPKINIPQMLSGYVSPVVTVAITGNNAFSTESVPHNKEDLKNKKQESDKSDEVGLENKKRERDDSDKVGSKNKRRKTKRDESDEVGPKNKRRKTKRDKSDEVGPENKKLKTETSKSIEYNDTEKNLIKKIREALSRGNYMTTGLRREEGILNYLPGGHVYSILGIITTKDKNSQGIIEDEIIKAKNVTDDDISRVSIMKSRLEENRQYVILRNPHGIKNINGVVWSGGGDKNIMLGVANTSGLSVIDISILANSNFFSTLSFSGISEEEL
ncbi:MAG: leucine-rich repeat protein [Acutalibacteraceae bacterium]